MSSPPSAAVSALVAPTKDKDASGGASFAAGSRSAPPGKKRPRHPLLRFFFRFLLLLIGIALSSVAAFFLVCHCKGELIIVHLEQQLRAATGMPWQIKGTARPKLFPYPGITLGDVRLPAVTLEQEADARDRPPLISVSRLHIAADIPGLLDGDLGIRLIDLESPDITFAYDAEGYPLWSPRPKGVEPEDGSEAGFPAQEAPAASETGKNGTGKAAVSTPGSAGKAASKGEAAGNGGAEEAGDARHYFNPPAVHARYKQAGVAEFFQHLEERFYASLPEVRLTNGAFTWQDREGDTFLSFDSLDLTFSPRDTGTPLRYTARFSLPSAGLEVAFSCSVALEDPADLSGAEALNGAVNDFSKGVDTAGGPAKGVLALVGKLEGTVSMRPPESREVTGAFSAPLRWERGDMYIRLPGFSFAAEGDSLTADARLDLIKEAYFADVEVHNFSLSRWFKFARNLPPGLQEPLHTVSGTLQAVGTQDCVYGTGLDLHSKDFSVRGFINVPDFSAPTVVVDLALDTVNLDGIFPFLTVSGETVPDPVEPQFTMLPLAPYPGSDSGAGPDVGYDVVVKVKKPLAHRLSGGPAEVRVFPVADGLTTRVAFTQKDILDGKLDGYIDVRRGKVRMHFNPVGMRIRDLPENQGNSARVDGRVTGTADIDIVVDKDGHWAEDWELAVNAEASNLSVTGGKADDPWHITFSKAKVDGNGSIHAVRADGIRIDGNWDASVRSTSSSWFPKGKDDIAGQFKGALAWLPMGRDAPKPKKGGVYKVSGKLDSIAGSLMVPIGSERVPLKGKMNGELNWNLHEDTIELSSFEFDGLGSYVSGALAVDASGRAVTVTSPVQFKVAPRVLLKAWNLLPSGGVQMPAVLTGKSLVTSVGAKVVFDQLDVQADGDSLKGSVTCSGGERLPQSAGAKPAETKGVHCILRLASPRLNLDNFFPEAAPEERAKPRSTEPWKLSFLRNLSLDLEITAEAMRFQKMHLKNTKAVGALQRGRFSLQVDTKDFYGGVSSLVAQGVVVPERSQVTMTRLLGEMKGASLDHALYDITGSNSYGGKADVLYNFSGVMHNDAEKYAGLSGIWSMNITDGTYPAFLGSESAGLRNTFTYAEASGEMKSGVLVWNNFVLSGTMVDMKGAGSIDLTRRDVDISISVTLARVPTVPVRLHGSFDAPVMSVHGGKMVTQTAQAAGSTIFGIIIGVLELPGTAAKGIGELFSGKKGVDTQKKK